MRIKEKIKEKLKQKWNDKAERYKMAGLFCLFVTVVILSLALGSNSRAENLTINEYTFEAVDGKVDTYKIKSVADLKALGSLTEQADTNGRTFILQDNIEIKGNDISLAKGAFYGTFDGNGYIITIKSGNVSEDGGNSSSTSGILFGKVAENAVIQNLIIEAGTITYKKTSNAGVSKTKEESKESEGKQEITFEENEKVYPSDRRSNVIDKYATNSDGNKYYTSIKRISNTFSYEAKAPETDYFGILCGELSGTIQQVMINGESLDVTQNIKFSGNTKSTREDKQEIQYIYKNNESEPSESEIKVNELSVEPTILKATPVEIKNEAVAEGALTLTVSVAENASVKVNDKIAFNINVENTTNQELTDIKITETTNNVTIDTVTSLAANTEKNDITATYTLTASDLSFTDESNTKTKTFNFSATAKAGLQTIKVSEFSVDVTLTRSTESTKETTSTISLGSFTSGAKKSGEIKAGLVSMVVSTTPVKVESNVKQTAIPYTIKVTNTSRVDVIVTGFGKTWEVDVDGNVKESGNTESKTNESKIPFTIKGNHTASDINFAGEDKTEFTISNITLSIATTTTTTTDVVLANTSVSNIPAIAYTGTLITDDNSTSNTTLLATLSCPKYIVAGDDVNYTFEMRNTNVTAVDKTDVITLDNVNLDLTRALWHYKSVGETSTSSPTELKAGESVTYEKTIDKFTVLTNSKSLKVSISEFNETLKTTKLAYYTLEIKPSDKIYTGSEVFTSDSKEIFAGNSLYAGVYAGHTTSTAAIKECVQNCPINTNTIYTKSDASVLETLDENYVKNDAISCVGLLLGKSDETIPVTNIHIPTVSISASDTILVGAGNINTSDIIGNSGDMPDTGKWKEFSYYNSDKNLTNAFTLSWLVKDITDDTVDLTWKEGTGKTSSISVSVELNNFKNTVTCSIAYQAKKSLNDMEELHYSFSKLVATESKSKVEVTLDLGNSGYYYICNIYMTDGYYHYVKTTDINTWKYPYLSENDVKPNFENSSWSLNQRETGTTNLNDSVTLSNFKLPAGDSVFYSCVDGENTWTTLTVDKISNDSVTFVFSGDEESFTVNKLLPKVGSYYYPIVKDLNINYTHNPLPVPSVKTDFYKDNIGTSITEYFATESIYESGTTFSLANKNEGCSYKYLFSPSEISENIEESELWIPCTKEIFQIPEYSKDGNNTYHFYVKVSSPNYKSVIKNYGWFTVKEKTTVKLQFYYDKSVTTKLIDSDIAVGDILKLELENSDTSKLTQIQYIIGAGGTDAWLDYNGEQIEITDKAYAISIRLKSKDNTLYSSAVTYNYSFINQIKEATISPATSSVGGSGTVTSVSSGTKVSLQSSQSGSKILYVFDDKANTDFTITRINDSTETLKDGVDGYYKVGERWYQVTATNNAEVSTYSDASSIILLNQDSQSEIKKYVHTVVLSENREVSNVSHYEYTVLPVETVSNPEAVLKTRHNKEGGGTIEVAQVMKNAYLTFTSLTQGAELYYEIGTGTEAPTREYDASTGIQVTGEVGSKFYIRVQAKDSNTDENTKLKDSEIITFEYVVVKQDGIVAPSATPATSSENPSIVIPGSKILLSSNTKDATIYYTTDGSYPDVKQDEETGIYAIAAGNTSTKEYKASEGITMPLDGSGYFTIRAVNTKKGMAVSEVVEFIYAYPTEVLSPYASVQDGAVAIGTQVLLKNRTEGATIYYTFAYGAATPDDPTISSSVFDGTQPFEITKNTTIKAMAMKDGIKSGIVTFKYTVMDILAAPTASLDSGSIVSRGSKLTLKAQEKALIYYTLDGSEPNAAGNAAVIQGNTLVLDGDAGAQITVKAYATLEGMTPSEVVIFTYQISQSTTGVTADIPSGTEVSNGTKVNLISDVTDAVIYYTTDGSSPLEKGKKGNVVTIAGESGGTVTIKAAAVLDGASGSVVSFTYKIKEKPGTPNASPAGGVLTIATYVELSASVDKIYYTTDGTTPTESSTLYEEPILINRTTYLQAIAVSDAGECSEVSEFQYTAAAKAEKPTATLEDGSILEPGSHISLFTDTPSAVIYYSTDGTDPTLDNLEHMIEYTEDGISIQRSVTIKAVAYRADMQLSNVSTYHYVVETIPAVEVRKAEQEKLEAEGLHDTDASELERREDYEGTAYESRILKNEDYGAVVSSTWDAIPAEAKLVVEKSEREKIAEERVKQSFGEDYTILSSYEINLSVGSTMIQPNGEVEIGIPIPKEYENASVSVIYMDSEHKITKLQTRRKDGMAYAKVNHFSNYALVGRAQEKEITQSQNYLTALEVGAGIILSFGVGFWIWQKWKKFKKIAKDYPKE